MTGSYNVISATPETVTAENNGEEATLLNDRCIQDPMTKTKDADQQDKVKYITGTLTVDNTNNNQTTIENTGEEQATNLDTDDDESIPTYHKATRTTGKPSQDQT